MKGKIKFIGMICAMFLTLMIGIRSEAAAKWYTVEGGRRSADSV